MPDASHCRYNVRFEITHAASCRSFCIGCILVLQMKAFLLPLEVFSPCSQLLYRLQSYEIAQLHFCQRSSDDISWQLIRVVVKSYDIAADGL